MDHDVKGLLEETWSVPLFDAIFSRRSRRFGLGMEIKHGQNAFKSRAAPIPPQEIGGDPAFIEKDEAGRVESRGGRCPLRAGGRDVGAIVFGRAYRFFYG